MGTADRLCDSTIRQRRPIGEVRFGMRIDLIITELPVGGAERCLTELALGLQRRGESVRVWALGPLPQPPRDLLVRRLRDARLPVLSLDAARPRAFASALLRLRSGLRQQQPDVVQTFLHHANVLATWAAKGAGVPVRVGGIRVAQPSRTRALLERSAVRRMTGVVCVSQSVARFAEQQLGTGRLPMRVIPNGVDAGRFASAAPVDWTQWGLPADAQVVLYVGRLDPQKGIDCLFAAADRLLAGDPRRYLVLAGDGPLRPWVRQQCEQLPGGRARLLPWQPDVAPLLAGCRLLLLASRYEGMPNVVLEAMAAGRPVACTDVEGAVELLGPAAVGQQIVPAGDAEALAAAADRFVSEPQLAVTTGQANRRRAAERYSLDAMTEAYLDFYRQLLAEKASGDGR